MPCGFEFGSMQNPVRVLSFFAKPSFGGNGMVEVALEVEGGAGLEFGGVFGGASRINNRVDVHVSRDMRKQVGAFAGQEIDYASGKIAGGENFSEGCSGERMPLRSDYDRGIAAENDRRRKRDEREQGRPVRSDDNDDACRFRDREIEMGTGNWIYAAKDLRVFIGPAGIIH